MRILGENRELARAIWEKLSRPQRAIWRVLFKTYGILNSDLLPQILSKVDPNRSYSLLDVSRSTNNPFQQEYLAISFALKLIPLLKVDADVVAPNRVLIKSKKWDDLASNCFPVAEDAFQIEIASLTASDNRFRLPEWVQSRDHWKYELGMLLRVLLTGIPDYTLDERSSRSQSQVVYRAYVHIAR